MRVIRSLAPLGVMLLIAVALAACRTSKDETFNFDAAAHQRATELKSKTLALVAMSGDAYSQHRTDVEALNADIENAYELSAAAPDNEAVIAAWAAMKAPEGNLYGGFVRRWQASGRIDEATRDAALDRLTVQFDYILCLEAAKRTRGGICAPPGGETQPAPAPAQ
jgi:hypothetical protein